MDGLEWFRSSSMQKTETTPSHDVVLSKPEDSESGLTWFRESSLKLSSPPPSSTTNANAPPVILASTLPPFSLIINADDFGYSKSRDLNILSLFRSGCISQTSLMVNGVSAREALVLADAAGLPVGIHINVTEGKPVLDIKNVKSLLTADGVFRGKMGFRAALTRGAINLHELEAEIQAQFSIFKTYSRYLPTHADGHQHIHILPFVREFFATAALNNGVRHVRLPIMLDTDTIDDAACEERAAFNNSVSYAAKLARDYFLLRGLIFPNFFVGFSTMGSEMTIEKVINVLSAAAATTTTTTAAAATNVILSIEWMVHPGQTSSHEISGCEGNMRRGDDFSLSFQRTHEATVLSSESLRTWLRGYARLTTSAKI